MEKETAITAKLVTIPAGIEVAKICGIPINDVATYAAITVSLVVILDYLWKWYRQWKGVKQGNKSGRRYGDQ